MVITIDNFFKKLLHFFPEKELMYNSSIAEYSERLDTVIIEDIFMPEIIKLLNNEKNPSFLKTIFDYFELVSIYADKYLLNVFSITVLEILGNDKRVLDKARKYMGNVTTRLQYKTDKLLGRIL